MVQRREVIAEIVHQRADDHLDVGTVRLGARRAPRPVGLESSAGSLSEKRASVNSMVLIDGSPHDTMPR